VNAKKSTVLVMAIVFALGMACTAYAFFVGDNVRKLFEPVTDVSPIDAGVDDGGDY
jgi:hypothetical protein